MPIFYQQCTFHFDFNNINPRSRNGITEDTACFSDGLMLEGIKKLTITGIPYGKKRPYLSSIDSPRPVRLNFKIGQNGSMKKQPQLKKTSILGRENLFQYHPDAKELKRVKRAKAALAKFYKDLADRRQQAQKEAADGGSDGQEAGEAWSGFVEGPEMGLGLRREDLEGLMEIFGSLA